MLDDALKDQLKALLVNLRHPIELVLSLDDSSGSAQLRELAQEVAAASSQVTIREAADDVEARRPSFLITEPGQDSGVRFAGLPLGHEFSSLVLALLHVGGHPPKEDDQVLAAVRALNGPLHFETFFSVTCHNCPDVVQALNLMSALNPAISHTAIEGGQFPAEVEARGVLSVPTVFLNGELFDTGRMTLAEIVRRLDSTSDADAAAELSARAPYDVLVVGGGPAGATAAIYAARKGIRTAVVAERMGGQVLDTAGIENIPSILHTEGTAFGAALERHCQQYNVDLVTGQTVTNLAAGSATEPVSLTLANGAKLAGRTVILATGARWRDMGVPGEQEYRTKGVTYCPHCDGPLFAGKPVAVIGGGNSGIEAAIDLAGVASQVTVLEFLDQLKADDVLIKKVHSLPNVTVLTSVATTEVIGDGVKVTGLRYRDRTDESVHELELAGIFVQIGLQPNNEWLRGGPVELNQRGEIVVDGRGATNVEAVFAAGDGTTQPYKQIIISCGAGATAALSAFDHLMRTT